MNILFLSHRIPYPPNKGDKIRSFNEIKHFSKKHAVHLLAFCDDATEYAYKDHLKEYCRSATVIPHRPWRQRFRAASSLLKGDPWTLGYYSDPRMVAAVAEKIKSIHFDLIFVYSSSMAPYVSGTQKIPRVLDFVDSDASKWKQYADFKPPVTRWLYAYEAERLARFEKSMVQAFDRSIFVSSRETRHLSDNGSENKIQFIQNGIEIEDRCSASVDKHPPNIVFVGAMDYFPNIDGVCFFAREILPYIREKTEIQFLIVGSRPSPRVTRLGKLPGVTVTGTVNDVQPYLKKSSVAVVPTRIAQGIQNKILEALAAGLPVVATRAAAEGLNSRENLPIAVTDHPKDFAGKVLFYLNNPLSESQIEACHNSLMKRFSWESNLSEFDKLFDQLTPNSE